MPIWYARGFNNTPSAYNAEACQTPTDAYVIHIVMLPTYFILNQFAGVEALFTVKSGNALDCNAL